MPPVTRRGYHCPRPDNSKLRRDLTSDLSPSPGRVRLARNAESAGTALEERAGATARGIELHESRRDSWLLLGARHPFQSPGGVPARQSEGDEGHRPEADHAGACPPLPDDKRPRSADADTGGNRSL